MGRLTRRRFGLQARMTASYVVVTAAAVVVVEAIAIGYVIPNYLASQDLANRVTYTASALADKLAVISLSSDTLQLPAGFEIGAAGGPGPGKIQDDGAGLVVPDIAVDYPDSAGPLTVALVVSTDGTIIATSYPARYPVGAPAGGVLPSSAAKLGPGGRAAVSQAGNGEVAWDVEPVYVSLTRAGGIPGPKGKQPDAYVYVQAPVQAFTVAGSLDQLGPLLQAGVVVLLLALPVGAIFGLLTMRGPVRRLRRLASTATRVADGDFDHRVTAQGSDEVGVLERSFNEMAERLDDSMKRERLVAERSARQAERDRISRDLHDSISQDLFSISLLAAGLAKALPADSPLQPEVRALVESAETTNREMRALLLELRPASLEDRDLGEALQELAGAYSTRLGLDVELDVEKVTIPPPVELAALRIAQEALANAVRHSNTRSIAIALHRVDGRVVLTVADHGTGFTPERNGAARGLGLKLMQERAVELGGTVAIRSEAGKGTVVSAELPVGEP